MARKFGVIMSSQKKKSLPVKKLRPEHLEQFNELLRYAFQVTEAELLEVGWEDEDIRQSKFPILETAHVLGCFDGDRLASQIAVYPMTMNLHGAICNIGFVTGVATYPEYSGMGLISKLMKRTLREMRRRKESLALLYPYSIPLYRHKGWEIVSDKMTFRVKDFQLPKAMPAEGFVRRVAEDSPDLTGLHERFARKYHGCLFRNSLAWEEYWRWDVEDTTVAIYYSQEEEPLGYMVYLLKNDVMYIKEMVYLNTEAWNGLWNYISAHESMVNEVSGSNYSNEPIAFWLEDSDIKETIRPYIMGRIIDVEQFLRQYRFVPPRRPKAVTFVVEDDLLEWNNRSFTVAFDGQGGAALSEEEARRKVVCSIGTLTTMLMSYKRPTYLQNIGRIEAEPDTVSLLESLIPMEKAHISDYI